MIELAKILALIAVLGTAVVYGTDVFCAVVQRPASESVNLNEAPLRGIY